MTNAGLASFGTRLEAVFNNIPNGVNVYVSVTNVSSSSGTAAVLVGSEAAAFKALAKTDTVTYPAIGATDVVQLAVVKGSATAVWEVTAAQLLSTDDYLFTMSFEAASDVGKNLPALVSRLLLGSNDGAIQPTPGFVGYIIATCGFENAHGIAILSDAGLHKFAASLPVLVIPEDSASALKPARSESLGQ